MIDIAAMRASLSTCTGYGAVEVESYRQDVGELLDALEAALARAAEAEANHRCASCILAGWRHKALRMERERDEAADKGAERERAAVVAWLQKAGWMPSMVEVFKRGEHRREEAK